MCKIRLVWTLASLALVTPALAQDAPPAPSAVTPVSDRAWNLDNGKIELHGSLPIFGSNYSGGGSGSTFILAGVGGAFGVSDQLELGGDYAFQASPNTDAAGVFAGHALFRVAHDQHMSAALGGAALYSHAADGIVIAAGLSLRYRLNKQVSIYTMSSGVPICGGCLRILGPVTGQLVFAIPNNGSTEVFLNLPAGIGIQASPELYVFGETSLGTFLLSPRTDSIVEFSDYFGITAGAWLSTSKELELGAAFADDLKHAGDIYIIELMARIHL